MRKFLVEIDGPTAFIDVPFTNADIKEILEGWNCSVECESISFPPGKVQVTELENK